VESPGAEFDKKQAVIRMRRERRRVAAVAIHVQPAFLRTGIRA